MADVKAVGQSLAGESRIPVMAVNEAVLQVVAAYVAGGVLDPFGNRFTEGLFANELVAATGKPQQPHALIDLFFGRLVFKLAGQNVDMVTESSQTARQFQDKDNLTSRVRFAELRFRTNVPMRGDHHDPLGRGSEWHYILLHLGWADPINTNHSRFPSAF